ncbi:DNA-directed RNA polymerase subunit beta' [Acidobacteria bacterium Mor1]|nr:DNA-directed RNA polymerase subunit beta' [Acidobacteria bacterium Mor1]
MSRPSFLFDKARTINDFSAIRISLASPEKIRSWSFGEVVKPETINYRTFKPERDGLFCARIFGPITDWECLCGKFKRMKHRGVVCDKCGVEVTQSKVRRERMGHIELASPVSHVWFFKGLPSRIGHLLDMSLRELERILYFEAYVVIDPGECPDIQEKEILSEEQYREHQDKYPDGFHAGMGAEAIKELLARVEVDMLARELRERMRNETSQQKRLKFAKRLKVVDAFRKSGNRPEWMILDVIPVIPPELRPLVPLDGGRFATSDLNDLYRRVINRNNRLKKLLDLKAPDVIVRNEKRMLQEAVDALFDNGRRGRVLRGSNNRPLKSLSDTIKGKQGRFRQNLLGKRVDYSGRSVIVVGPDLKLHQCGLPKKMALELYKPFIYNKLEEEELVSTIKAAKEMVELERPEVWDYLEEVIREHPVLLNRAPTLHRLGIQAFEPVLVEGKAIKIHPLVCTAFNADFDGDQMAVHIPLSAKAQIEAMVLMLSTNNILSPANGMPIVNPSQDIVLGCYYLTQEKRGLKGEGRVFGSTEEVILAYNAGEVETLTPIVLNYTGKLIDLTTLPDKERDSVVRAPELSVEGYRLRTTVGRVLFNDAMPEGLPYFNGLLKKKGLQSLVHYVYLRHGAQQTVTLVDKLKEAGFNYATRAGVSIGVEDMVVPPVKADLVERARENQIEVEQQYLDGLITDRERYNKVIAIWSETTEKVSEAMFKEMTRREQVNQEFNPILMMADSGARGSKQQMRQLAGMRGLMAKPSGEIIETPITANFREGLNVLQYFISTHGARKGLADTALKTANSGYLTRRLVDVSQDVIITEDDCETLEGIEVSRIEEGGEIIEELRDRIVGRVALEDVVDPLTGDVVVPRNGMFDEDLAREVQDAGIETVKIRSVLTCECKRGVCIRCYGRNLATGRPVEMGEATGVIAAQSIGEPGTQLTMRTFHIGGTARFEEQSHIESRNAGTVRYQNLKVVENREGKMVAINRNGSVVIQDREGRERERYNVVYGAMMEVEDGQDVTSGTRLAEWDPYNYAILTDVVGTARFHDIEPGVTMKEEVDENTGYSRRVIVQSQDEKRHPQVVVEDANGEVLRKVLMPVHATLMVQDGGKLQPGDLLAKIARATTKTKDITGGLPRVVDLFEARHPKDPAVMAEVDGIVHYGEIVKGARKVVVRTEDGEEREYSIPKGLHVNVQEGEMVRAGDAFTDGPKDPHKILEILGERELQKYLLDGIQEVYRLQGVNINDKHIEIIVRQMMRWIKVEDPGDTEFIVDEQVDRFRFVEENERVLASGGAPARGRPLLLGITKASLSTDSFISAASFQETTRVLTEASISGKVDYLRGLKENVIMGRLIPAGTGMEHYRSLRIEADVPPPVEETPEEVIEAAEVDLDADRFAEMIRQAAAAAAGTDPGKTA